MICAELDLSGKIEDDISVLPELGQLLLQPVIVGLQVLHAVQYPAIGTEAMLVHDIFERD